MSAESQAASLLAAGYIEVEELRRFKVGGKVHHIGERFHEAYSGTAVIERIFHRPHRGNDVEMIVRRTRPDRIGEHGYWADYHTIVVEP